MVVPVARGEGGLVQVEDFARSPVALDVGEHLPAVGVERGECRGEFVGLEVCVAGRAGRDAERAATEPRLEIGFVEEHGSAVGRAVVPELHALYAEVVVPEAGLPVDLIDLLMAQVRDRPQRDVWAFREFAEHIEGRERREKPRDPDRRESRVGVALVLGPHALAARCGGGVVEAESGKDGRRFLEFSGEPAVLVSLETASSRGIGRVLVDAGSLKACAVHENGVHALDHHRDRVVRGQRVEALASEHPDLRGEHRV